MQPQRRVSKVEPGDQRTEAEPVGPGMKMEPNGADGTGKSTSDKGIAGETREPGEGVWLMVSRGAKGGRSQGGSTVSTGRSGVMVTYAGGGDRGSSMLDELVA